MSGVAIIPPYTRRKIIQLLASELSYRQLAINLGVTPASIHKYVHGIAVPGDPVIEKAINLASEIGLDNIGDIIITDIAQELNKLMEKLISKGLVAPGNLSKLSDVIMRSKLALTALTNR